MARTFATLDHLSGGRIAWNVVPSQSRDEAQNYGFDAHLDHEIRSNRADECVALTHKLWESRDDDALVMDQRTGLFADPDRVHAVEHAGEWFRCRGPLSAWDNDAVVADRRWRRDSGSVRRPSLRHAPHSLSRRVSAR